MKKVSKKDARVVKDLPGQPRSGVLCRTKSGQEYVITYGSDRSQHILWHKTKDKYTEIALSDSPVELYDLIDWLN